MHCSSLLPKVDASQYAAQGLAGRLGSRLLRGDVFRNLEISPVSDDSDILQDCRKLRIHGPLGRPLELKTALGMSL